jgi:hypothetical protein
VAGPRTFRRLLPLLAALTLAWPAVRAAAADELLRVTAGPENEARPVVLAADEAATWSENGQQVFLLRGKVLIEQGVFSLRADRAVLWVASSQKLQSKTYAAQVIADGAVRIEDGTLRKTATTIVTELATRQEVKLRKGAKAAQQPQGQDPFYRRATALRPTTTANAIQLTAATAPAEPTQNPVTPVAPPPVTAPLVAPPPPRIQVPGVAAPGGGSIGPVGGAGAPARNISIQRRTDQLLQIKIFPLSTGEKAGVVTGGVILTVRDAKGGVMLDIEADRLVAWTSGDTEQLFEKMRAPEGTTTKEVEFFLSGNVELRSSIGAVEPPPAGAPPGAAKIVGERILRAEQVYYDVHRNVAVAVGADLQFHRQGVTDDLHVVADELVQVSPKKYEAVEARIFSSRLPSDPGLQLVLARATIEDTTIQRRGIFGQTITDPKTGQPETYVERLVRGEQVKLEFEGVPVLYLPVVQGDANDPFGPLQSIGLRNDHIYGAQVLTTFNMWNLLNRNPVPNVRWTGDLDYLSRRGPAAGTQLEYGGKDLFGLTGPYAGVAKVYGIYDDGTDVLGGNRGTFDDHPEWRGRILLRHNQTAFDEFNLQGQLSLLSDKNFLEQYWKQEFDTDVNNETYLYFRQQRDQWAYTIWAKPHVRDWVTEDVWLPRADGYLIGQSFFNLFTYNAWASAGYAELRPTSVPPFPWPPQQPTDVSDSTARLDLMQEISLPFYLGPVRVVPYGFLDLTYYSKDLTGNDNGRLYGGGGLRSSMPLSRLYPNVESELFNLNGLYHKIVLESNFFLARSSDPYTKFPQLDRLNDDATDQALRDIYPRQPFLNPTNGFALATSPIFDPQLYAIRRLVEDRIDTRDSIDEIQLDVRQRWQTKRGYPGQEHVIDYLTLDTSIALFPNPDRDNFGKSFAFLEYDTTWNVGDRTAVVSSGWYDPFDHGAHVFNVGTQLNRPDRTSFYLGFRYIDPVESRAVITAATYVFSPKYAITASSVYDFGTSQSQSTSLIITRVGSDLTMNLGFSYNAILANFGVTLEIIPNVVSAAHRPGTGMFGSAGPLH